VSKLFFAVFLIGFAATAAKAADGSVADEASVWFDGNLVGQAGVMGFYVPKYVGSDDYKVTPLPMVDLTWHDRLFLSSREGLGAYALSTDHFQLGGALNYSLGRDSDDVGLGTGIGDIDGGLTGAMVARWSQGPFFVGSTLSHQLTGEDTGFLLNVSAGGSVPVSDKFVIIGSVSVEAADSRYMDKYFGLSAADAATAGLSSYDANAGIKSVGLMAGLGYNIFDHWTLMTMAGYTRLLGDAADSPLVATANQYSLGLGLTYRFGSPPDLKR
jgi:MipA family protein